MTQGGFFEPKRVHPAQLTIVIAAHAAAITALALAKADFVVPKIVRTHVFFVPDPVDPPPQRDRQMPQKKVEQPPLPAVDPLVRIDRIDPPAIANPFDNVIVPQTFDPPAEPPKPMIEPVRMEAQVDPRFADRLQPPYPLSEQRAGNEGIVKVRVRIGADGRVVSVEKVAAASDAFFEVTQRHALRQWRFKPATLDGSAVESVKVMTVRFQLER
ncbi:energy transducer TonB [Sphingomonas sp.]|uniref:energy transducer TonB n=1 Tax=Sphingomonas sp. TaxID=28214 RepID=UPI002FC74D8E